MLPFEGKKTLDLYVSYSVSGEVVLALFLACPCLLNLVETEISVVLELAHA